MAEEKDVYGWRNKYSALSFFVVHVISRYRGFNEWWSTLTTDEQKSIYHAIENRAKKWDEDYKKIE